MLVRAQKGPWEEITRAITANFSHHAVRQQAAELMELARTEEAPAVEALRGGSR